MSKRYFFRELLPRSIVAALVFGLLLPRFPAGGAELTGGITAAVALGAAFTGWIVAAGQFVLFPIFDKLVARGIKGGLFAAISMAALIACAALFLMTASVFLPFVFTIHSLASFALGTIALVVTCMLTHDYAASAKSEDSAAK